MFWNRSKKADAPAEEEEARSTHWYTYMVRCADGSLYTDVTDDISATMLTINAGHGPVYTRTRYPVFLVHHEEFMNEADAERRADLIRKMNKRRKEVFISDIMVGSL